MTHSSQCIHHTHSCTSVQSQMPRGRSCTTPQVPTCSISHHCSMHCPDISTKPTAQRTESCNIACALMHNATEPLAGKCACHHGRIRSGFASSSTGRNSRAEGPKFRKLWKGLRPADRDFEPETGVVSTKSPAKMHLPASGGPFKRHLVEIGKDPSTSWSKSPRGACEPWIRYHIAHSTCCSCCCVITPAGRHRSLAPIGRWSDGCCALGRPVLLCGSRRSAGSAGSSGHSSAVTVSDTDANSQSRLLSSCGTCRRTQTRGSSVVRHGYGTMNDVDLLLSMLALSALFGNMQLAAMQVPLSTLSHRCLAVRLALLLAAAAAASLHACSCTSCHEQCCCAPFV
jgi:hypothetical protein